MFCFVLVVFGKGDDVVELFYVWCFVGKGFLGIDYCLVMFFVCLNFCKVRDRVMVIIR